MCPRQVNVQILPTTDRFLQKMGLHLGGHYRFWKKTSVIEVPNDLLVLKSTPLGALQVQILEKVSRHRGAKRFNGGQLLVEKPLWGF